MSDTKDRYSQKRLIHLSKEQEERIAKQKQEAIQSYVNELNQVQARRFELGSALMISQAQYGGVDSVDVAACREKAEAAVFEDGKQKWAGLRAMFIELGIVGPLPALEWASKQVGVELFDAPKEEPMVLLADIKSISEATQ